MNTDLMFSSKSDNWSTPQDFYQTLNAEFNFDFDPCPLNATFNGLEINWKDRNFVNPPYSNIAPFLQKGWYETYIIKRSSVCVFLIPARTDTRWFHQYIYNSEKNKFIGNVEVRFIKGRLKFGDSKNSAPFPSMLVIFRGRNENKQ